MSPREREDYRSSLHVLELMREGESLTVATHKAGTSPRSVARWVGPVLEKRRGRWVARPADRLARLMKILGEGGVATERVVRGSRAASLVGEHWSAIGHYLDHDDPGRLERFRGKRVAGIALATSAADIDWWDMRSELAVEDIYSLTS